ncbi:MAG: formate--tetrahydrofolate ligase [Thermoplasmata archaeon]
MKPISEIASKLGFDYNSIEPYGKYIAKIPLSSQNFQNKRRGKLILVTAMTPTSAGEGKTTTVIGLGQALSRLGKNVSIAIREPSLGPCFGVKGGATGGGKSTVEPSDRINLIFTGDFPAVSAAHNLLSAVINNHMHFGNKLSIDPKNILFPRTIDMNDRSLRSITVGVGDRENGALTMDRFVITPASEMMAILGLSKSYAELKQRLSRIIVALNTDGKPVYSGDLNVSGALAALLVDALKPNLVQTSEGVPAFIHTGPFGNIAHGTSSIIADELALRNSDYLVTEAGFGSDLGAEKFLDMVSRLGNLPVNGVVIVGTLRAIKHHAGSKDLSVEDVKAVEVGSQNLLRHVEFIRSFGIEPVVAINRFPTDTAKEIGTLENILRSRNITMAVSDVFGKGGEGGIELANAVLSRISDTPIKLKYTYEFTDPIKDKIIKIAKRAYGADDVIFEKQALKDIKLAEKTGFSNVPICMAKTQNSLSDNPALLNAPTGFKVTVTSVGISSGAGFLVPFMGNIMTMPGLPRVPAAENVDITESGEITGLF